ncbi:putative glutathione-independent glyoxalase [Paramyrothecium foliicola]|nr:putative glutathione-independent glyoxalase [Paramyrothecium foliicola]
MARPRILIILTSVDKVPKSGKPVGWFLPELAHPWHVLKDKVDFTYTSPQGGEAPLDARSVEYFKADPVCNDFLENHSKVWKNTIKLSDLAGKASDFDGVFYPGGHGPMFDLVHDETSLKLLRDFHSQNKIIAGVCHGQAAFVNARTADGGLLLENRNVTGLDNVAEEMSGYNNEVEFSLEDKLNEVSGGKYVKSDDGPFGEKVVVDGKIITGQNPASSYGVGNAIALALGV